MLCCARWAALQQPAWCGAHAWQQTLADHAGLCEKGLVCCAALHVCAASGWGRGLVNAQLPSLSVARKPAALVPAAQEGVGMDVEEEQEEEEGAAAAAEEQPAQPHEEGEGGRGEAGGICGAADARER